MKEQQVEAPRVGSLICDILHEIDVSGVRADRALKAGLRRSPWLDNRGRAHVGQIVHGVRCHEATLAFILNECLSHPAQRAAAYCALLEVKSARESAQHWPQAQAAFAAAAGGSWKTRLPAPGPERLAVTASLPLWLARRLWEEQGEVEAEALMVAMNQPAPLWLRVNTWQCEVASVQDQLGEGVSATPGPVPGSLRVTGRLNIRGHPAWQRGAFEVQDLGSQWIARSMNVSRGARVLDLCAGRGGKTLALAAALGDTGELWASDVDDKALLDLKRRAQKAGLVGPANLASLEIRVLDPALTPSEATQCLVEAVPQGFDGVLVDAPCSALGTLRRGPDRRWRVLEDEIAEFAALQHRLLVAGARLLRPGGRLVYATCSILAEENSEVAATFGAQQSDLLPAPLLPSGGAPWAELTEVSLLPHRHGCDGFFLAAWEKARDP